MILFGEVKKLPTVITLIISLILITPLCGVLFQCGCDWPWLGLNSQCNYHKLHAVKKCPWCVSLIVGVLSTGIAILSGGYASIIASNKMLIQHPVKEVLLSVLFGITVFVLMTTITALPFLL